MKSVSLLILLVGTIACAQSASQSPAADSSSAAMFRGGPDRSGLYRDSGLGIDAGIQWRKQTSGAVRSSPTIADGVLFIGSSDGILYALDANSGHDRWRYKADSAIASTPAVSGHGVFFSSYRGTFYSVDRMNGSLLWKARFGAELQQSYEREPGPKTPTYNADFILSSPVVSGDLVMVGAGDGSLYAFDVKSGHQLWQFPTGGRIRSSPSVSKGIVYVGSYDGSLYAIDCNSGKQIWRFDTKGKSIPASEFGFDRTSITSSPAVVDGVVYIGSRDAHLYAVDAARGTLKWLSDYEKDNLTWVVSSPAVNDEVVYVGTADGHFVDALRANDGHQLWRFAMPSRVWSSPIVAGQTLYVTNQSGSLYAIDLSSGKEKWRFETKSSIQSSPVLADGTVYFGSNDGGVYAIRVDGSEPMQRAVYVDEPTMQLWDSLGFSVKVADQLAFRDFFQARGYELLNAATLGNWLAKRTVDRKPSVIVSCSPTVPESVGGNDPAHGAFRQYLTSGGKVLWIGYWPPLLAKLLFDKNNNLTGMTMNWAAADALIGVSYKGGLQTEMNENQVTPVGREWGLPEFWLGVWEVPTSPDITVLSTDDRGLPASWVKSYGGPPGTGFVQLALEKWDGEMLNDLALVAEYRPHPGSNQGRQIIFKGTVGGATPALSGAVCLARIPMLPEVDAGDGVCGR
jgi:outer membrane protein assembly factor BamB